MVDRVALIFNHSIVLNGDARQFLQHITYGTVISTRVGRNEIVERIAIPPQFLRLNHDFTQYSVFFLDMEVKCLRMRFYTSRFPFDIKA